MRSSHNLCGSPHEGQLPTTPSALSASRDSEREGGTWPGNPAGTGWSDSAITCQKPQVLRCYVPTRPLHTVVSQIPELESARRKKQKQTRGLSITPIQTLKGSRLWALEEDWEIALRRGDRQWVCTEGFCKDISSKWKPVWHWVSNSLRVSWKGQMCCGNVRTRGMAGQKRVQPIRR